MSASESLTGPDGRTAFQADHVAKLAKQALSKFYPHTDIRQQGYGPASFELDLGDDLIATVTVAIRRSSEKVL